MTFNSSIERIITLFSRRYKVTRQDSNTGYQLYVNLPPPGMFLDSGFVKGQRLFAYMNGTRLFFSLNEKLSDLRLSLGMYSVAKTGARGLRIAVPRAFREATGLRKGDYVNAHLVKGELYYEKERSKP